MEDFYKKFRDKVINRAEEPYEERLWERLREDLVEKDESAVTPASSNNWWKLAAIGLLLLFMIGSTAVLYRKMQHLNQQIQSNSAKRDTIVQVQTIHIRDTIYQTEIIYAPLVSERSVSSPTFLSSTLDYPTKDNTRFTASPLFSKDQNFSISHLLNRKKNEFQNSNDRIVPVVINEETTKKNLLHHWDADLKIIAKSPINLLETKKRSIASLAIPYEDHKQRKKLIHYVNSLKPTGIRLGALGGMGLLEEQALEEVTNIGLGLEGNILFSDRLQLWINATYNRLNYESNQMGEQLGIPLVSPPSDDFVFNKAQASQPFLQYSIGSQYFFNIHKKLRPLIGLGFGAVQALPYDVAYEFEQAGTGLKWEIEEDYSQGDLLTEFLLARAGVEYQILKKWNWNFNATYRVSLNENQSNTLNLLNFQTGLYYQF